MRPSTRPVFLDLSKIRFPIGAVASILHRVAGVLLALTLPLLVFALERSVASEASYESLLDLAGGPLALIASSVLCWALAHHLLAGVRHLLMDVGVGASLAVARRTAAAALAGGVVLALLLVAWGLW
ncbi:MAG TPA: succinate dehydrogenase, cytochrome b556 subunit [Rhodocyclaceae bacterium]|nr:succinate dehydrogenase, cytochrome b556 subunit [Rhodocyclaceae bacterium]